MRKIRAKHFFNSSFKEFSLHDNVRSIPSITDGMKQSQRKAVYGMLKRGENAPELQVERLAGAISADTQYHHGIGSMCGAIIGLANNYAGSNNVNYFVPSGQFGSRLTKEAAAARYIFSTLHPNFRKYFKKDDDCILEPLYEDGEQIEPVTYLPILPMILINGAEGTGTGHACNIFQYSPSDVRQTVIAKLLNKKVDPLVPWFRGFNGTVERDPENISRTIISGKLEIINPKTILITELPIGFFLDKYKAHLNDLIDDGKIRDFIDESTEEGFYFTVTVHPDLTTEKSIDELMQMFKLVKRDTENLTVWDVDGILRRFETPEDIVDEFIRWRLERYEQRRQVLLTNTANDIKLIDERIRFILYYLDNSDKLRNLKKADLISVLSAEGFEHFDQLLGMPIWNLTRDKIESLQKELKQLKSYMKLLETTDGREMYLQELHELEI